ncbi:IucA/IucC family protein [Kitasatospora sp. NPDC058965]|uniref:IucA/IucC family protein n=1 Tax=Kitasatospora sp. NPDC058965 TaxID=3346682 RepID=UPI0036B764D7
MTAGTAPTTGSAADTLTLRVLSALLREDVAGLRTASRLEQRADGPWLVGRGLALPVRPDGFQCELAARLPLLEVGGVPHTDLDTVLAGLRDLAGTDPETREGFAAFAAECRQTLATMLLHERELPSTHAALADRHGPDPASWTGPTAALAFDTLAAYQDHPVYPTARGRAGLTEADLRGYAPECHPTFDLRWLVLPAGALTVHGRAPLPAWWPTPEQLGLPELTGGHLTVPVHPLSVGAPLARALAEAGLTDRARLADRPYLAVLPTLSMRTVAVAADPLVHLKLPLATATLGLRNRRTIKPGTLRDGAAGQRLLAAVIAREPRFAATVLLADEQCWAHADHELLAVLLRRYPAAPQSVQLPLAALPATAPSGRPVVRELADRFYGGDPRALFEALLDLLLDWQVTLFGHGIALESHQQNVSLLLDHDRGRTRLRLLLKDNDGLRVNLARAELPFASSEFDDPRILVSDDRPLTDLFTTITGHLCTAALAFHLDAHGLVPLDTSLGLLRERLAAALDRLGPAAEPLRRDLLAADRLPVKAMVSAGSLYSKARTGAADINKHYTTGPNYLAGR